MFKYILIFIINLVLGITIYPYFIDFLKMKNYNQNVSEYALEEYKQKAKTPIMGGVLFILLPVISVFLCSLFTDFSAKYYSVLLIYLAFGLVGFADDYIILIKHDNAGLGAKTRLIAEALIVIVFYLLNLRHLDTSVTIPLFKAVIELKHLYLFFILIMFLGEANACNFTDGMDGLCAGCSFISLIPLLIYSAMSRKFELVLIIMAVLGALLAYLKYNRSPAKIFMGDSGSLALGALFSVLAVFLKVEIPLVIILFTFFIEIMSVIIQITSVKLFKRRVFAYTPIHYSFIIKGKKEKDVVKMFYLFTTFFAFVGFLLIVI